MQTLLQDLRSGMRVLFKQPGFAIVAILALALGIGLNGAFFSMIDAILLKPINLPEPDRTVAIWESIPSRGVEQNEVAPANFIDWKGQSSSFEEMALYTWWSANLTGVDPPERVRGFRGTASLLAALGVKPALGRSFSIDEEQPGRDNVVILNHGLWQRHFGGDPEIVGKSVTLNGVNPTEVGVLRKEQDFPRGGRSSPHWHSLLSWQQIATVTVTSAWRGSSRGLQLRRRKRIWRSLRADSQHSIPNPTLAARLLSGVYWKIR